MEEKLHKYFTTLRYFGHVLMNKLLSNGRGVKYDFKISQLKALAAFKEDYPYTMNALAENAMVKLPNMTRMVDSLIKDGIAERGKSDQDRRKVLVRLTAKGKRIRTQFLANRRQAALSVFSMLSEKDKRELMTCLDKACKILEKTVEKQ